MSKEKVDAYKERKANRKEELEKEKKRKKRNRNIALAVVIVFCLGLVGALGLTGWNIYQDYLNSRPDYAREELILTDYAGMLDEDTE